MALRILITNNTLANRAGTELYVRDVACALKKRGHLVAAYSNVLGEIVGELRQLGIPVFESLDHLPWRPDIIHGHHHLETMTALLRFPGVPAIYVCHGFAPWEETPPAHPRIIQYVAVDITGRDAAVNKHGVPTDRIQVIPNYVDLDRFKPRGLLPAYPAKALVFSNYAKKDTYLPAIREACLRRNIKLDVLGIGARTIMRKPEKILGNYDLVFAKGRSALEALATGAAVIPSNTEGVGPMVNMTNVARLRGLSFGRFCYHSEVTVKAIEREIDRYDRVESSRVSEYIRSTAGLNDNIQSIIALYQAALEKYASSAINPEAEARAEADYMKRISGILKERCAEQERLKAELSCYTRAALFELMVKKTWHAVKKSRFLGKTMNALVTYFLHRRSS